MGPPLRRWQRKITDNRQNLLVKYVGAQYFVPVRYSNCVETGSPVPVRVLIRKITGSFNTVGAHPRVRPYYEDGDAKWIVRRGVCVSLLCG